MVQGGKFKLGGNNKKVAPKKIHSRKQSESGSKTYHTQTIKPKTKSGNLNQYKESQKVTKMINRNIEKQMAGKVIQAGERLNLTDIKTKGKAQYKEIKQGVLKKKKTGIEEKMSKLKAKLDRIEGKGVVKGGGGFMSQEVIDRV